MYQLEEKAEITRKFEHDEFLAHIGLGEQRTGDRKNIAIIGEPGAGKTTLLEKIARVIHAQNKGLPICISLASLETGQTLEDYLMKKWLKDALPSIQELAPEVVRSLREVPETLKDGLADRFTNLENGGVWLLLDGLDEMKATSPVEALTNIEKYINCGYLTKVDCQAEGVWERADLRTDKKSFAVGVVVSHLDSTAGRITGNQSPILPTLSPVFLRLEEVDTGFKPAR